LTRHPGHHIRARDVPGLEKGIRRIASLAAQRAGLVDRGAIEVGHHAVLVLFESVAGH
jgi:N-acyl-D-aspartate/D-glutamate deacylase